MQQQKELQNIVAGFANASLEFIQMNGRFKELFNSTKSKNHYSKEMFYKFLPPRLFPDYDKIIITDVDVVYQGDISKDFADFNVEEQIDAFHLSKFPEVFTMEEEDMDAMMKAIQDAYWIAKKKNKRHTNKRYLVKEEQ